MKYSKYIGNYLRHVINERINYDLGCLLVGGSGVHNSVF